MKCWFTVHGSGLAVGIAVRMYGGPGSWKV